MSEIIYNINDLVWAKMKGYTPWPGRVTEPPPDVKKSKKPNNPAQCIFFFGSNNYAWIEESQLKPYDQFKDKLKNASKSGAFKEAIDAIEAYIADPETIVNDRDPDAEFNKLRENSLDDSAVTNNSSVTSTPASTPVSGKKAPKRKSDKLKIKPVEIPKMNDSNEATNDVVIKSPPPKRQKRASVNDIKKSPIIEPNYTTPRSKLAVTQLLNRPTSVVRPETPEIDVATVSNTLRSKNINASGHTFGFLGLGTMGCGIVKNLINSGHKVVVWNRTSTKCRKFEEAGAEVKQTPSDVIDSTDITFSCVSDPQAAKDMVFGNCGVLSSGNLANKGYVEMTGIDSETSQDIAEAITNGMGRYLEAQIQGSKSQAEEGTLIILAAGDKTLFEECQTCFEAMGRNSFYLGDVGNASKMNLVFQMFAGVSLAGLAEAMALADRAGLQQKDVLEVLELTTMASQMITEKGQAILKGDFPTHLALSHMQKDLKLALSMAETLEQPLPLAAASNEVYKHAKRLGYGDHDASAVYVRARF